MELAARSMSLLSQNRLGRALLHVLCIVAGGNRPWHWEGILRELRLTRSGKAPLDS